MSKEPMQDQPDPQPSPSADGKEIPGVAASDEGLLAADEQVSDALAEAISLEEQLTAAQAQAAENLDGWQRARAELANYRKRVEREREQWADTVRGDVIAGFLPVVDDLDRALAALPGDLAGQEWVEGIVLIARKLHATLEAQGVTEIEAEGQPFDPTLHEAVMHEPSNVHEAGYVVGVVQKGYQLKDRVIRPARVRVAQ